MYHPRNYSWLISQCSGATERTLTDSPYWDYTHPKRDTSEDSSNPFKIAFFEHKRRKSLNEEDYDIDFEKKLREVTDLKVTKPVGLDYYIELAGLK